MQAKNICEKRQPTTCWRLCSTIRPARFAGGRHWTLPEAHPSSTPHLAHSRLSPTPSPPGCQPGHYPQCLASATVLQEALLQELHFTPKHSAWAALLPGLIAGVSIFLRLLFLDIWVGIPKWDPASLTLLVPACVEPHLGFELATVPQQPLSQELRTIQTLCMGIDRTDCRSVSLLSLCHPPTLQPLPLRRCVSGGYELGPLSAASKPISSVGLILSSPTWRSPSLALELLPQLEASASHGRVDSLVRSAAWPEENPCHWLSPPSSEPSWGGRHPGWHFTIWILPSSSSNWTGQATVLAMTTHQHWVWLQHNVGLWSSKAKPTHHESCSVWAKSSRGRANTSQPHQLTWAKMPLQ